MAVRGFSMESCLPVLKRFLPNEKPTFPICTLVRITQVGEEGPVEKTLEPVSFTYTEQRWERSPTPFQRCDSGREGGWEYSGDIQGHQRRLEKVSGNALS